MSPIGLRFKMRACLRMGSAAALLICVVGCEKSYDLLLVNDSDRPICVYNDEVRTLCVPPHKSELIKGAYYKSATVHFKTADGRPLWWFSPTEHDIEVAENHNYAFHGSWNGSEFRLTP